MLSLFDKSRKLSHDVVDYYYISEWLKWIRV